MSHVFENGPVEYVVVLESLPYKQVSEDLPKIWVVGFVVKPQCFAPLPWEGPSAEIHQDVTERFEVIPPALFCIAPEPPPKMPQNITWTPLQNRVYLANQPVILTNPEVSVYACVTGRAGQVLVFPVRYVQVCFRIAVFLGETEINDVDLVASLAQTHKEVVGFDIAVKEFFGMDVLNPGYLPRKLFPAEIEEVFQRRAEEVDDHRIVFALGAGPSDERYADATGQVLVHARLVHQLGVFRSNRLELDGDLLAVHNVCAFFLFCCKSSVNATGENG
ncbi:MAG: hypothetical protein BJ554DRAFT_4522 [Olpidium bornovanus]|uniref:Uncharacterized protein n=1 Tax=Olpidium bornovanus TaxID=278681 RepID=A0A8H7ZMX3_9FUNG|nr:MAG: hypothetical protein BJ554DRAFT_4522 [Olpidium bornovanus]